MDFLEQRKKQLGLFSVGERIKSGVIDAELNPELFVNGPELFDCLTDRWSKGEVLSLIGGSGSGKTQLLMTFFAEMLKNNPNPKSICIFASLEMTEDKIAKRWVKLVGKNSPLSNRLYVIGQFDENGKARNLTLKGIEAQCSLIKEALGVDILSVSIDHLHIIQPESPNDTINQICSRLKNMAVQLNTLLIPLSQVPKDKAGPHSDLPLYKDDSFGNSGLGWYSSYSISIHQPIARVKSQCGLNVLAWAYVKIRDKEEKDEALQNVFKLLYYEIKTGLLRKLTKEERTVFNRYIDIVRELQTEEQKNKGKRIADYEISQTTSEDLGKLELLNLEEN